jgi:hypothetical protein
MLLGDQSMTRIVTLTLAAGLALGLATAANAGGFGDRGAGGFATGSAVFNKVQLLRGHTSGAFDATTGPFQMSISDDIVAGSKSVRVKGGVSNTSGLSGTIVLTGRNGAFEGFIGGTAVVGSSSSIGKAPKH